jgi:TPR repeat protein
MSNLGALYAYGLGVAQDYGKASEWLQKAADAGDMDAMNALGVLYQNRTVTASPKITARPVSGTRRPPMQEVRSLCTIWACSIRTVRASRRIRASLYRYLLGAPPDRVSGSRTGTGGGGRDNRDVEFVPSDFE